jgi:hypothetical protein
MRPAHALFPARCDKFVIGAHAGLAYCVQRLIFAICKMAEQLPVEMGVNMKRQPLLGSALGAPMASSFAFPADMAVNAPPLAPAF